MGGYVKNPFLSTYLFSPETLAQAPISAMKDPDWCLESLNDGQKLAVKKLWQAKVYSIARPSRNW